MKMLRIFILLIAIAGVPMAAHAQVSNVRIGVNGLTCSQCTRNVEMSLRKLPFVQDVKMDLQHTDGQIILKRADQFDPQAIAKAVKNAGFSMRFLECGLDMKKVEIVGVSCMNFHNDIYQLIPFDAKSIGQTVQVQFIGEPFLPAAALKKWKPLMVAKCHATRATTLYFVTLIKEAGQ